MIDQHSTAQVQAAYGLLREAVSAPPAYTRNSSPFWDDPHISGQMLRLHLDPHMESASRTAAVIDAEVQFIISQTGMKRGHAVVDLGCGPGLYAARFAAAGARVTGIDLSERSIAYAIRHTGAAYPGIEFIRMNYLDLDFRSAFHVATLIFYDFCVLNPEEQQSLLARVNTALKPGGRLVFDVVTENRPVAGTSTISASEGGFWSPDPYLEIMRTVLYEKPRTEGMHYTIIEAGGQIRTIRLYHRLFSQEELCSLLTACGFTVESMFNNLQGAAFSSDSPCWGIIARKV